MSTISSTKFLLLMLTLFRHAIAIVTAKNYKNSIGHRPLRGRCPSNHHTPTYTHIGATGTADHLTLLRLFFFLYHSRYIVGNHLGPYLGQPPTGKLIRYRFSMDWYLKNGKVRKFTHLLYLSLPISM